MGARRLAAVETLIVSAARERGVDVDALHARMLVHDYAFDPDRKYLSHVWRDGDARLFIAAKGAVEGMLERVGADTSVRRTAETVNTTLADEGMRVIAIAGRELAASTGRAEDERETGGAAALIETLGRSPDAARCGG